MDATPLCLSVVSEVVTLKKRDINQSLCRYSLLPTDHEKDCGKCLSGFALLEHFTLTAERGFPEQQRNIAQICDFAKQVHRIHKWG